uniref:Uncharacterized protein n=1 Tax=Peronospora matthiolae TaxID=2874970 RepID=A0AAV1UHJ8_9STRA
MYQPAPPPHTAPGLQYDRVPDTRQRKLGIRPLDGKDLYQGLGSGILSWGKRFVRQIMFAERASGFQWSEDVKEDVLGHHLTGMAERYYSQQVEGWFEEQPTPEHAMQRLLHTFATKITPAQRMKIFTATKSSKRSWTEHYLYLVAVSEACGGADNLVQDNIVHYADPNVRVSILARFSRTRIDYLQQAEELAHFAQSTEVELRGKNIRKDEVDTVDNGRRAYPKTRTYNRKDRRDMRTCYNCGKPGHLKRACPEGSAEARATDDVDFVLTIGGSSVKEDYWILDSGSSRHLVNDASLLEDPEKHTSEFVAADGGHLRITMRGSVIIATTVLGKRTKVRLTDVYFAENLERNIISYGLLESKGCGISYRGELDTTGRDVLMSALAQHEEDVGQDVQKGSLMHFHKRLAHLNYDTIIRMTKDPASGIQLTDELRANCLACAQGKQTKNPQSRKDTGRNAPIDVIGGVICSDLKGPMAPRDRLGNRYLVNFIDHRTNYCRVFLAKSKDVAAQRFKHFMAFFERQINCRIHVLRADGGGEYKTLELFCKDTGIARQVSEPRNQASNEKAERMHRTIINMVRSMLLACGLPLSFWGDAAEYAVYILNRSPSKANLGRQLPLQMLTKSIPDLSDIVAFGSPCTVHRDASNKSLGERGKQGIIIGKIDEMKGYRVYLPREKTVIVTQHVRNVEILTKEQNAQLRRVHPTVKDGENGERGGYASMNNSLPVSREKSKGRGQRKPWTRDAHMTRTAAQKVCRNDEESTRSGEEINSVREADPKNYGQAMRIGQRENCLTAMSEELQALEDNGVWLVVVPPNNSHVLHTKWV